MSIIRNFVTKIPLACGVDPIIAKEFGKLNKRLFDLEKRNPNGPLNRKRFVSVADRLAVGIDPWKRFADPRKLAYAVALLEFAAKTIDANGGEWKGKKEAKSDLALRQADNPEVAALMTVEQAATMGNWA